MRSRKDEGAPDWETFSGRCEPTGKIPLSLESPFLPPFNQTWTSSISLTFGTSKLVYVTCITILFLMDPCHKKIKICQWRNKKPLAGHNCNQCCDPHDIDSAKYIFDWRGTILSTFELSYSVSAERGLHHTTSKASYPFSLRQKLLLSFPCMLNGNRAWLKDLNPDKHLNPKETHLSGPTTQSTWTHNRSAPRIFHDDPLVYTWWLPNKQWDKHNNPTCQVGARWTKLQYCISRK